MHVIRAEGITGWRRQVAIKAGGGRMKDERLKVRPDFVFRAQRVSVFVDGCFWHGCPQHATRPRGNAAFWRTKFTANRRRDRLVTRAPRRSGWRVLRIWEHELARKNASRLLGRIRRILAL